MTRNTKPRRGMTIGVERLDQRLSLSGFGYASPYAANPYTYTPTPTPTFQLPPNPTPPYGYPATPVNITPYGWHGLS